MSHFIAKYLRKIDQYGDEFIPRINYNHKQHKSVIGGVGSIIIYTLSFCYFLYGMIQWGTYQNLPKVTLTNVVLDPFVLDVNSLIATIFSRQNKNSLYKTIDPFSPNNMVLMVTSLPVLNNTLMTDQQQLLIPQEQALYDQATLNFSNRTFAFNPAQLPNILSQEYVVMIQLCNQSYVNSQNSSLQCANSSYINSYWQQALNVITFGTEVRQYNIQNQQMQGILKQQSVSIEQDKSQYLQCFLRTGTVSVDTSIFIPSINTETIIYDIQTNQQTVALNYIPSFIGDNVYLMINFKLDYIQVQQNIEFQKIADALADIGSIVSIIMMFSYFFFAYNEDCQNEYIYRKVIEMYYPEMKQIEIKKNIVGKPIQIVNHKTQQEYNIKEFQQDYKKLILIAKQKLTYLNQIYEISRLQFLIEEQIIQKSQIHELGMQLPKLQSSSDINEPPVNNIPISAHVHKNVVTPANEEAQIVQEEANSFNQAQNYNQYVLLLMENPDLRRQLTNDQTQNIIKL